MIQDIATGLGVLVVVIAAFGGMHLWGQFTGERTAYRQLTTGQATVISYTVPGSGVCRAVLVDGKRHGEVCEGER